TLLPGPTLPGLVLLVMLAAACGSTTDGPSGDGPSGPTDSDPGGDDTPSPEAEAPGPWVPSRALAIDRFTLETALRSALDEPLGGELTSSTVWTTSGDGVDLRLQLWTWFNGAEAEQACAAAAGAEAQMSLGLGTPSWSTPQAVYVTRGASCIRVSVARTGQPDLAGAGAVAEALVAE
ncbi:MAG TPA: hypothetical protein VFF12_19455, partial [Myxococcaceae bacterium]|nr:hypothetical protein [Myxococcaceae bacterium]